MRVQSRDRSIPQRDKPKKQCEEDKDLIASDVC